jgi:hypothetical protein
VGHAVEIEGPSEDALVAGETPLPEVVRENCDVVAPGSLLVREKGPTELRLDSEQREQSRRDRGRGDNFGSFGPPPDDRAAVDGGEP